MTTPTTGNLLIPPPRLTGRQQEDLAKLSAWCGDLFKSLALESNVIGAQEQTTSEIAEITAALAAIAESGLVFQTYAEAVAAAAAGSIEADILRIETASRATAGDEGGAGYRRTTVRPTHTLWFPDADGSFWELDESSPHIAMAGAFGSPLGADAATTEDAAPILTALAVYLSVRYGGGMIRLGWRNYYLHTDAVLEPHVGLEGPVGLGHDPDAGAGTDTIEVIHYQPALCIKSNRSVRFATSFVARYVGFRRHGITIHTDLAGALTAQTEFSGTLLQKVAGGGSARGVILQHCNFWGAAFGAYLRKCPGLRVHDCYGDCATLLRVEDCGENILITSYKRKSLLTGNASTSARTLTTASLFDSGGKLGVEVNESLSAEGLTTGQRIASDRAPTPYEKQRRTVTVLTDTTFVLEDTVWDAAYATWSLTRMDWTFQPGLGSAVTAFYNSGGKVGVQTAIDMPFVANNFALLGVPDTSSAFGFWKVLTRVAADDFVLDTAWEAGLSGYSLAECELAAMPGNRRHASAVAETGTTEGFAVILENCDGAQVQGTSKGGSGVWCNSSNCAVVSSNEGGSIGELDLNDPSTRGIVYKKERNAQHGGAWKSTGKAVTAEFDDGDRMLLSGVEMVDNGYASLQMSGGTVTILDGRYRGDGRIRIEDMTALIALASEFRYENLVQDPSILLATYQALAARAHFEGPAANKGTDTRIWRRVHYQDRLDAIKSDATLQRVYDFTSAAAAFSVPVTAPNIVTPFTAYANTTSATALALTTTGGQAASTASGYSLDTNKTSRLLRMQIIGQRTNGTGAATDGECAMWDLVMLMSRANNAASTVLVRTAGLSSLAPTEYNDADAAAWRVTVGNTAQNLYVNATGAASVDVEWQMTITALEAGA